MSYDTPTIWSIPDQSPTSAAIPCKACDMTLFIQTAVTYVCHGLELYGEGSS